jgi:hypothetical protein
MTYGEFLEDVSSKCLHETIYTDSEGHPILVIRLLDAYGMVNKLQRSWLGLTHQETKDCMKAWDGNDAYVLCRAIEAYLKEKNT